MSIFRDELTLPGTITEIYPDYSFGHDDSQFGNTDSVLIIGTAFNGPVGNPVPIYNPEHAQYVFGKAYDSATRQEATLVKGVEDAFKRGCRTIYGVRVSGKNVEKNFNLVSGNLKLRVRSLFPSKEAKDCYMAFDNSPGDEKITIYKPASRATLEEKMFGMIESDESVLKIDIRLNADYNISSQGDIAEMIRTVNEHQYNNVLRLSVVGRDGEEMLPTSEEAKGVKVGSMFPGIYFIGRDQTLCPAYTTVRYEVANGSEPFVGFEHNTYRRLVLNTDVTQPYPIYASDYNDMADILREVQISTSKRYDFLETLEMADRAFKKDNIDYEEVDLSSFDIYKNLGSGFAVTARAEKRESGGKEVKPRVIETPLDDPNRVQAITAGIYNRIESHGARYRVLNCAHADQKVDGLMPQAKDFLEAMPRRYRALDGMIDIKPIVDPEDMNEPKKYRFDFVSFDSDQLEKEEIEKIDEDLYKDQVMKVVPSVKSMSGLNDKKFENGTLVLCDGKLYRFTDGKFVMHEGEGLEGDLLLSDGRIFEGKKKDGKVSFEKVSTSGGKFRGKNYVLAEANDVVHVMEVIDGDVKQVNFVGDAESLFSEDEDKLLVFAPSNYLENNRVIVKYSMFDAVTVEELVEMLNEHEVLNAMFKFELSDEGQDEAATTVTEIAALKEVEEDRMQIASAGPFSKQNLSFENGLVNVELPEISDDNYNVDAETGRLYFSNSKKPEKKPENEFNYKPSYDEPEFAYVPFVVELPEDYEVKGLLYSFGDFEKVPGDLKHKDEKKNTAIIEIRVAGIKDRAPEKEGDYSLEDWELIFEEHVVEILAEKDGEETGFVVKSQVEFDTDRELRYNYSKYIPYKTTDNFVRQLAQHCTYTSLKTAPTHGMIGHKPIADRSLDGIANKVEEVMERDFDLYAKNHQGRNMLDRDNMPYHIGRNVSVTLVQYPISVRNGYRLLSNGAAGYAGMVSRLPIDQSSTNQPINISEPQLRFSNHQLGRLTQKGYVTTRQSYGIGLVITDGITMAPPASPFKRLSVTRVISGVEELIREACEPFIGKQNSPANRNALHTAIKARLEQVKGTLIETYTFNMITDPRTLRFSRVEIDYRIIPVYEIREVRNRITVQDIAEQ